MDDPVALPSQAPTWHRFGLLSRNKGVRYAGGCVKSCRFCEILRMHTEPMLYDDDDVVVFRPLHPVTSSHVLIVPRVHIKNVTHLTTDHIDLLKSMHRAATTVLSTSIDSRRPTDLMDRSPSLSHDPDKNIVCGTLKNVKCAFHLPPFNSIDHVHMHAFFNSPKEIRCYGRIKYWTSSSWCCSYEDVLRRLTSDLEYSSSDADA